MRIAMLAATTTLLLLAASTPSRAQQSVTIYRCTDASGAVTVQNDRPCPKGSSQSKRVLEGVPTAPPPPTLRRIVAGTSVNDPAPPPPAASPASNATTAVITAAPRVAPPVLFECKSFDGVLSLTETRDPVERCAPLATTGVDGNPARGAGEACEMRTDTCVEIAATDLCERWQQRLRDAQAAERFGNDAGRAAALAEMDRARQVLTDSTCAAQ